jgi:hypothetical protein
MTARQIIGMMTRSASAICGMNGSICEALPSCHKSSSVSELCASRFGINCGASISPTRCCRRHASHSRLGFQTKQAGLIGTINFKPASSLSGTGSVESSQCSTTAGFRIYFALGVVFCLLEGDRTRCEPAFAYVLDLVRRGADTMPQLRAVYPHPFDSICSTALYPNHEREPWKVATGKK